MKHIKENKFLYLAFTVSLLVWLFCFKSFISGKLAFTSDALSYYDHIKFYIHSLGQGIYPQWDPNWSSGMPNEFFLRRLGSYNPFYLLILVLNKIGIKYLISYNIFLVFYYFLGLIGFFLLNRLIFKKDYLAFLAYLLLLFSSLSTRIFDSYIMFSITPMYWFFYFLISFSQTSRRRDVLGIVFCLMLILTTYIPFYFINIFLMFMVCFLVIYWKLFVNFVFVSINFIKTNKLLSVLCVILVILSAIPGITFVLDGSKNELVMPHRHYTSDAANQVEVGYETITQWGMLEDIFYSLSFTDFRMFKFAILYIPILGWIIFSLGLFAKVNKRILFCSLFIALNFLIFCEHFPCYKILYGKLTYFKYFRNLHFYLWFAVLPVMIIFIVEQFKQFSEINLSKVKKFWLLGTIGLVHCIFLYLSYAKFNGITATYLNIAASFILFCVVLLWKDKISSTMFLMLLLLTVIIQPVEVYNYLNQNAEVKNFVYQYDAIDFNLKFVKRGKLERIIKTANKDPFASISKDVRTDVYVGLSEYNFLKMQLNYKVLGEYERFMFYAYDKVKTAKESDFNFRELENSISINQNLAYVIDDEVNENLNDKLRNLQGQFAEVITDNTDRFSISKFNPNEIRLKTNFKNSKFIVINDVYHPKWKLFVNGKLQKIYRSNYAFKGFFVPEGKCVIALRFTRPIKHLFDIFMCFVYLILLIVIIGDSIRGQNAKN